jgi:hypothetical protein
MRNGFTVLAGAALSLMSVTATAVPITVGFLAEIGRVNSAPFDFGTGSLVRGAWTYDSDAVGEGLLSGAMIYRSEGPMYGLRIEAGDNWPAFHYEGIGIAISNDFDMIGNATETRCREGDRIADVYRAGTARGAIEPWNFLFFNCSARAFDSAVLPSSAPKLGLGFFDFLQGRSEAAMLLDFRAIGGPQTFVIMKDVFLVPEPDLWLLLIFACFGLGFGAVPHASVRASNNHSQGLPARS